MPKWSSTDSSFNITASSTSHFTFIGLHKHSYTMHEKKVNFCQYYPFNTQIGYLKFLLLSTCIVDCFPSLSQIKVVKLKKNWVAVTIKERGEEQNGRSETGKHRKIKAEHFSLPGVQNKDYQYQQHKEGKKMLYRILVILYYYVIYLIICLL